MRGPQPIVARIKNWLRGRDLNPRPLGYEYTKGQYNQLHVRTWTRIKARSESTLSVKVPESLLQSFPDSIGKDPHLLVTKFTGRGFTTVHLCIEISDRRRDYYATTLSGALNQLLAEAGTR